MEVFGNLLDAGLVTICGEESAGTGSDHIREKDGLWAVLLWLNILAVRKKPVAELMAEHWRVYGRTYYARHDYEGIDAEDAAALMAGLRARLAEFPGQRIGGLSIVEADDFTYRDPTDASASTQQGIRVLFAGGSRIVFRLSGTGTEGATLRVYLERYEAIEGKLDLATNDALDALNTAARAIAEIQKRTGRSAADVVT